jgi:hypothetical protein
MSGLNMKKVSNYKQATEFMRQQAYNYRYKLNEMADPEIRAAYEEFMKKNNMNKNWNIRR